MSHAEWIRWMLLASLVMVAGGSTAAFVGWFSQSRKGEIIAILAGVVGAAAFVALMWVGFLRHS